MPILFFTFILLVIIAFGMLIWMYNVLYKNGYDPDLSGIHAAAIFYDMWDLASKTNSTKKKLIYKLVTLAIPGFIITAFILFILAIQ